MSGLQRVRRAIAERLTAVRRARAEKPAVTSAPLAGHESLSALLSAARTLVAGKEHTRAQSLVTQLEANEGGAAVAGIVGGVVASRQGRHRLAVDHFDRAEEDVALDLASFELLTSLLTVDIERGTALVRRIVSEARDLPTETWWVAVRHTFPTASDAENESLVQRLEVAYRADPEAWRPGELKIPWLRRWMGRERNATTPALPPGTVSFGVVDYGQPDRSWASQNIGDYIQTIAALGHVVRHRNLSFSGPDRDVVELVQELADRVRPELVIDSPAADVELRLVDRDASSYQSFPEGTWLLAFGWFMHPQFNIDGSFDFPLHPSLEPVFVSFHCNKRNLLTPKAVEYLRAHGPIGCRDWTTVDLLLSLDVPAFFSGCLTTTVNTVFPDLQGPRPESGTVYVDVVRSPVPDGVENVRQRIPAIKKRSFSRNMRDAIGLLEDYRSNFHDVITTRLHCYLPAMSIGMPVRFEPKHNADVRFNGLFRLDAEQFEAIRTPMRDRLQPVLEAIFSGAAAEHVRQVWQDTNAADVALARERHARGTAVRERGVALVPPRRPRVPGANAVNVVLAPSGGELGRIGPVLKSAAGRSSRPVRAWVLSTRRPPVVEGVDVEWVDISGLGDKQVGERATALASIAELVGVERAVLLPVDALVESDLVALVDTDLGESMVAARDTSTVTVSGFATLYRAGDRWDEDPDRAFELYRDIHSRHRFDFDAFDTDVLLLDLERLRASDASVLLLGAMVEYALTVRQAWHYLVGGDRAVLPDGWAHVPTRDPRTEVSVWVWADGGKPWDDKLLVRGRDRWRAYA